MNPTIYDVSRLSGVSIATVSRTFSNPDLVRENTRRKVFEAAEILHYSPNAIARAMARQRTDKVAFLKQEYSPEEVECLTAALRNLRDDEKGALVSDLYRLGSSPSSFVTAAGLSPGELRKLDLLLSLRAQPALLIMDEPTNHLDITSVMAFESLLSSSDLTLVLVSHDAKLRQTLCTRTVSVERKGNTGSVRLI